MPDPFGHAKDFFDSRVKDGKLNKRRGLLQYCNRSKSSPEVGDIIVLAGSGINGYGHIAIVSKVLKDKIEIVQQNYGIFGSSRKEYDLEYKENRWYVDHRRVLGWLRKS